MNIIIIDFGLSNLSSVYNTIIKIHKKVEITNDPDIISKAKLLILPGIGTYKQGMKNINNLKLYNVIRETVLLKKIPIIGICLGMQLFSTYGYEGGKTKGLDLIEGEVVKISESNNVKLPHIGWNSIYHNESYIFNKINQDTDFYFIHSYYFVPKNKNSVYASTFYLKDITAIIVQDNIYGIQFHPEKSQLAGLILLKNIINNIKIT